MEKEKEKEKEKGLVTRTETAMAMEKIAEGLQEGIAILLLVMEARKDIGKESGRERKNGWAIESGIGRGRKIEIGGEISGRLQAEGVGVIAGDAGSGV